jgi:cardiolipin synthase
MQNVLVALLFLNTIAAVFTVLRRKRDIATTWAWLLVLAGIPLLGFGFYLFAGRRLSSKRMNRIAQEYTVGIKQYVRSQNLSDYEQQKLSADMSPKTRGMLKGLWQSASAPLLIRNDIQLFTDGNAKFAALFADIDGARRSIAVEYYTIYPDAIGTTLKLHLIAAAKRGVRVTVLYDAWGSLGMQSRWWTDLRAVGGHVSVFFSSRHIFTDFRLNYRDHRKIVVIDDHLAYTGGFNVGDQYLGRSAKFGNWRDTHIRVRGDAALALKIRFVMDWNATESAAPLPYPQSVRSGDDLPLIPMQVVASGPDTNQQHIKLAYVQMIMTAERRIWIQTPYLVPDETVLNALIGAARAGVDVRIMIPNMPDHPFIFRASEYFAAQLHEAGVHIYNYQNGFLHAKTIICDDDVAGVGSANLDYRSFALNFEVSSFVYDSHFTQELALVFMNDLEQSKLLTDADLAKRSGWLRFKQNFSRMLAPIL